MTTIINIRGTSGSGKTTAVRKLMDEIGIRHVLGRGKKPDGYELKNGTRIVGSYESVCGGCDTIPKFDQIEARVREYAEGHNVIFEGLLVSATFGRFAELAREHEAAGGTYHWCFMATPLSTCLNRIMERRKQRGEERELNPENTISSFKSIQKVEAKARAAGFKVHRLDQKDSLSQLIELLQ